jgi:hypothetical protein
VAREVDLSKLRKWIGKASSAAEPPAREPSKAHAGADPIVQLNLKIPAPLKRRMKHLAAREEVNLATLLTRMVEHYERVEGALPPIERREPTTEP